MSAGGSSSSGDTRFSRQGTTSTTSFRELTPQQLGLFNQGFGATQPGASNSMLDSQFSSHMTRGLENTPYQPELCNIIRSSMPTLGQPGQLNLTGQAERNIYSNEYAENTYNRYADEVQRAIGMARSGPQATRGGTAAQGFMQAEAVNGLGRNREDVLVRNRQADAQIGQGAAQTMGGVRAQTTGSALQGIGTQHGNFYNLLQDQSRAAQQTMEQTKQFTDLIPVFATLASALKGVESNNLTGLGNQSAQSAGASFSLCCFIFMEAYNGTLPTSVRRYRDLKAPESSRRRNGYIRMSRWLVPAMRVFGFSRCATNLLLIKPLTCYGEWFYGNNRFGWVFKPVEVFWMKVWELIGKEK